MRRECLNVTYTTQNCEERLCRSGQPQMQNIAFGWIRSAQEKSRNAVRTAFR